MFPNMANMDPNLIRQQS